MHIACVCGETNALQGERLDGSIHLTCGICEHEWTRDLSARCDRCGGTDLQTVPLAIIEKGRGTQLSVVGVRSVDLCSACDAGQLRQYHDNRPNPLMPTELPTVGPDERLT